jgi:CHAD domain-containing protein
LQLFRLAIELLDIVPLEVETTSKAEYGYRIFAPQQPDIVRSHMPVLTKTMDLPTALQSMIWSCLLHLQGNIPGALHNADEEYLHQVRVALRRLRVVLGMAKSLCADDADLEVLHQQVATLCIELGRAREWDVFVTQTLAEMHEHFPERKSELKKIARGSEQLRQQQHALLKSALQSQNFQRLLLRFGAWMNGGYWNRVRNDKQFALTDFAAYTLQKRSKQVNKRGRQLCCQAGSTDARQWHALRISCKKLRYSAELFASLYAGSSTDDFLAVLGKLQDILGEMNDAAVAHRLLNELDTGAQHGAITCMHDWIDSNLSKGIARFNKYWKKFSGKKEFWSRHAVFE